MEPTVRLTASLTNSHLKRQAGLILNSFLREAKYPQWVLNPRVPGPLERLQQWVLHSLAVWAAFVQRGMEFLLLFHLASPRYDASPGASALLRTIPKEPHAPNFLIPASQSPIPAPTLRAFLGC